jgi:hypothetical protein
MLKKISQARAVKGSLIQVPAAAISSIRAVALLVHAVATFRAVADVIWSIMISKPVSILPV